MSPAGSDDVARRHPLARGFLLGVLVAAAMGVLVVQNTDPVPLEWLFFDFEAPTWVVLLVAFASGLVVAPLLAFAWRRSRHRRDGPQEVESHAE